MTLYELLAWVHGQPEKVAVREAPCYVQEALRDYQQIVKALHTSRGGGVWRDRAWPFKHWRQVGMESDELTRVQYRIEHGIHFHMRHPIAPNAQLASLKQVCQSRYGQDVVLWLVLCDDSCMDDYMASKGSDQDLRAVERCTGAKIKIYSEYTWHTRGEPWRSMIGDCDCSAEDKRVMYG